jgi:hypothetical protein
MRKAAESGDDVLLRQMRREVRRRDGNQECSDQKNAESCIHHVDAAVKGGAGCEKDQQSLESGVEGQREIENFLQSIKEEEKWGTERLSFPRTQVESKEGLVSTNVTQKISTIIKKEQEDALASRRE